MAGLGVALLALALRSCFIVEQYDGDMELFVYMGKLVSRGGRIGIELIDNKLPTVGLLMWPFYALLGSWWMGYALLSIAMAVAAVLAITQATSIVRPGSRWPTLAMASVWLGFPLAVFAAFKLEHVQILTGALAGLFAIRCWKRRSGTDAVLVGFMAGAGALAKPTSLSVLVACATALAVWREVPLRFKLRLVVCALAGLAIPTCVTLIYLVESRAITAVPTLFEQIRLYNKNSVWVGGIVATKFASLAMILGAPALMRGFAERKRAEPRERGENVVAVFAAVWFVTELAGVVMQGRMYGYHFLPMMVPAALLFGLIPRRPTAAATILSPLPVLIATAAWTFAIVLPTRPPADRLAANDYVKTHARPGDAVWMDEEARILVETDLAAGSRIPLTFIFGNYDQAPQKFCGMLLSDLTARSPRWIVLANNWSEREQFHTVSQPEYIYHPQRGQNLLAAWTSLADYVTAHYTPVVRFGTLDVYERKPATLTAAAE